MVKKVAMIKEFNSCHKCPYSEGGESLGSPMYCYYFDPPKQLINSNGHAVTEFDESGNRRWIAKFCELPENQVFNGVI